MFLRPLYLLYKYGFDFMGDPKAQGMFRQSKLEQLPDKTAEVAAVIAEEGLRYVSERPAGYRRKRTGTSFCYYDKDGAADQPTRTSSAASRQSAFRQLMSWYGFAPRPTAISRRRGSMRAAASNIAIIRSGANCATRPSTSTSWSLRRYCPGCGAGWQAHMKREGLPREKVLATIVSLLEKTLIRVGNAEYANQNKSYGLTTMRRKHVDIKGGTLRFEFTGKSGKQWKLKVAGQAHRCDNQTLCRDTGP